MSYILLLILLAVLCSKFSRIEKRVLIILNFFDKTPSRYVDVFFVEGVGFCLTELIAWHLIKIR